MMESSTFITSRVAGGIVVLFTLLTLIERAAQASPRIADPDGLIGSSALVQFEERLDQVADYIDLRFELLDEGPAWQVKSALNEREKSSFGRRIEDTNGLIIALSKGAATYSFKHGQLVPGLVHDDLARFMVERIYPLISERPIHVTIDEIIGWLENTTRRLPQAAYDLSGRWRGVAVCESRADMEVDLDRMGEVYVGFVPGSRKSRVTLTPKTPGFYHVKDEHNRLGNRGSLIAPTGFPLVLQLDIRRRGCGNIYLVRDFPHNVLKGRLGAADDFRQACNHVKQWLKKGSDAARNFPVLERASEEPWEESPTYRGHFGRELMVEYFGMPASGLSRSQRQTLTGIVQACMTLTDEVYYVEHLFDDPQEFEALDKLILRFGIAQGVIPQPRPAYEHFLHTGDDPAGYIDFGQVLAGWEKLLTGSNAAGELRKFISERTPQMRQADPETYAADLGAIRKALHKLETTPTPQQLARQRFGEALAQAVSEHVLKDCNRLSFLSKANEGNEIFAALLASSIQRDGNDCVVTFPFGTFRLGVGALRSPICDSTKAKSFECRFSWILACEYESLMGNSVVQQDMFCNVLRSLPNPGKATFARTDATSFMVVDMERP